MIGMLSSPRSGNIELVGFDGKHFRLRSPEAFAPGQPLTVTVTLASVHVLDLKSLGSVKRDDGFDIRARALTLRKETRDALLAHFRAP
ncbi:MAG TPA: hypothetical protein VI299_16305 [Polyangiales bacterium]